MFNAPLLFETALLMLAAFLLGAVLGTGARWLANRQKPKAEAAVPAPQPAASSTGPALVVAPEIVPVGARPTVAARIAAAAEGRSAAQPVTGLSATVAMPKTSLPEMPALAAIQPSHVAGETVTGRPIENPAHAETPIATTLDAAAAAAEPVAAPQAVSVEPSAAPLSPVLTATAADRVVVSDVTPEIAEQNAPDGTPVVTHIEPTMSPDALVVVDGPRDTAEKLQDTHPAPAGTPAPDVMAEQPLIEPEVERETAEENESLLERAETELPALEAEDTPPAKDAVVAATPVTASLPADSEDETEPVAVLEMTEAEAERAAMQAIEGGWTPRPAKSPRAAADLPEGVSPEESAAAEKAVANAGIAVASAAARAAAILEEIDTAPVPANDPGPAPVESQSDESPAEQKTARAPGGFGRPPALDTPRNGTRDDLGQIKGISPTIASALNGLGIYHFDQIADWDQKAVVWVENHFGFKGRIARERWQDQARDLAGGRPSVARPVRR